MMVYSSAQIQIHYVLNNIQSNFHPPESLYHFSWSMQAYTHIIHLLGDKNATRKITLRNSFYDTLLR